MSLEFVSLEFLWCPSNSNFVYTVDNRLEKVEDGNNTVVASYYYDPFGRRLWKDVAGNRVYFHYNDEGLAGEYNASGAELRTYGYHTGSSWSSNPLFVQEGGAYYWYLNDHLGAPQKIIAGNCEVVWSAGYDSFGRATIDVETIVNNIRFPGQYFDGETGLHYNWHRYYDPETGRYISADPIGLRGGINLYAYVQNDPVNAVDPWGLAKYNVFFDTASVGAGPLNYMEIEGWLVSLEKGDECSRCPGSYESIKFKGRFGGAGISLIPVASTRGNQEVFEDDSKKPIVRNVDGVSSILAGTAVLSDDKQSGFSGEMYNFGYMAGTNENLATTEGYDFGIDAVIGYTWTVALIRDD